MLCAFICVQKIQSSFFFVWKNNSEKKKTICWINFYWLIFTLERFSFRTAIFLMWFYYVCLWSILFCLFSIFLPIFFFFVYTVTSMANGLRTKSQFTFIFFFLFFAHKTNSFLFFVISYVFWIMLCNCLHFILIAIGQEKLKNFFNSSRLMFFFIYSSAMFPVK